jgi:uncharacterized protein YacL
MRFATSFTRYAGAAALLAVGLDHLDQYAVQHYSAIPTIGALFFMNFVSAAVVAVALAAPVERLSRRYGQHIVSLLALGGIGIAVGTLAGLLVSESVGLFGFQETDYRGAIVLSIVLDAATIVLLAAFVALYHRATPVTAPEDGPSGAAARPVSSPRSA